MKITVQDRLSAKYMLPPTEMVDPFTIERDGFLYLTSDSPYRTAILCDAIVAIEIKESE